jgi:hypothetical protein
MADFASVLWGVSLFGTEHFVTHSLTSVMAVSQEELNLPNSWRCLTHFCPTPKPERPSFTPNRITWGIPGRWPASPSASWGRPEFEPGFLPVWWVVLPSPHGSCASLGSVVCLSEALTPTRWEEESLLQIKLSVVTWWDLLPVVRRMHPGDRGGDNSPSLQSQQMRPQEMFQESQAEIPDTEAV